MEKFKNAVEPTGNVVLFDGLSIPQEDVYKNSYILSRQTLSNSKFVTSYESDFKKFVNANKLSKLRQQSDSWARKDEDLAVSVAQKLKECCNASTSNTSFNKTVSFKHSVADLTLLNTTAPDNPATWKADAEITHKSFSDSQSHLSQLNETSTNDDAYLCRVDPSKLLLKDIDYLRAKCRWNYKHISDYAVNPKIVERIRYLEMFTQCFSIRNYENDFFVDTDRLSENDYSNFGDGDDFDIYKKEKCVTYDLRAFDNLDFKNSNTEQIFNTRTIDDLTNIPERENFSVAVQETNDLDVGGVFKSGGAFTLSVPNVKNSSLTFNKQESSIKHFEKPMVNSELNGNISSFKFFSPRPKNSENLLINPNYDRKEKSQLTLNSSTSHKKSKSFFTAHNSDEKPSCSRIALKDIKEKVGCSIKSTKSSFHQINKEPINYKEEHLKDECGSNVKHKKQVLMKSKELPLENCSFEDKETVYHIKKYKPKNSLPIKENQNKSVTTNMVSEAGSHTNENDNTTQQSYTISETLSSIANGVKEDDYLPTKSRSTMMTEQTPKHESHTVEENSTDMVSETVSLSSVSSTVGTPYEAQKHLNLISKEQLDLQHSEEEKYKNDYIAAFNTNNCRTEDGNDNSEISDTSFSSRDSENVENTELFNKYFLNEFIMSVLRSSEKEKGITSNFIDTFKKTSPGKTKFNADDFFEKNCEDTIQNNTIMVQGDERKESAYKKSENKGDKPIIIIEYNSNNKNKSVQDQIKKFSSPISQSSKAENLDYLDSFLQNSKNVSKPSGTSLEVNSSYTNTKLTTIQEGSDSGSEGKPCEISFKILDATDSVCKEAGNKKSASFDKYSQIRSTLESDECSEICGNLKCVPSANSSNGSSDSSFSGVRVRTLKTKKKKKRKIKKRHYGDGQKNNDNLVKTVRKENKKNVKTDKKANKKVYNINNNSNNNAGQNVYVSCWKKYCVIL